MWTKMWTVPNLFTLLRLLLTPFILIELSRGHYMAGGWIFGGAAFTDIIDGWLARRIGTTSKIGQYFDPIADKLLLTSIYIGLAMGGAVPWWVVIVILARDFWILALSAIAFLFTNFRNLKPSIWGKLSTFAQIMAAVGVMAARAYNYNGFAVIANWLIDAVVVLAAISAVDYAWRGIAYLRDKDRTLT
jgi:cardiolipin synthase